jgi:hypothetical protein
MTLGRIEDRLLIAPYKYEWQRFDENRQWRKEQSFVRRQINSRYTPVAAVESVVPVLFGLIYLTLVVYRFVA